MSAVFLCGQAVVDLVFTLPQMPRLAEKYKADHAEILGGGGAANAAVAITRLGGRAYLGARLGQDQMGGLIAAGLSAEGVDLSQTARTAGAISCYSAILVDHAGERQIVSYRGSGLPERPDWTVPDVGAILADTRWEAGAVTAMEIARARGIPGIVDAEAPVSKSVIERASHVAFALQGLRDLTGTEDPEEGLRHARALTPAWLAVTDGPAGVWTLQGAEMRHYPAFPIQAVDTLGAGDIWHGAFALALAEGMGEEEAVRFASAAAAIKCTRPGGRMGAPSRAEVAAFLKERNGNAAVSG